MYHSEDREEAQKQVTQVNCTIDKLKFASLICSLYTNITFILLEFFYIIIFYDIDFLY